MVLRRSFMRSCLSLAATASGATLYSPCAACATKQVFDWIATNLPKDTYVNVTSRYRPMHRAHEYPAIARPLTRGEYTEAVRWPRAAGLTNLDIQG